MRKLLILLFIVLFLSHGTFTYTLQSESSFSHISLPQDVKNLIDENTSQVLFLFGIICVGGCPIGNYIQTIKSETDIVYILLPESTSNDLSNFRRGLAVEGKVLAASQENFEFVKYLAEKMQKTDYRENFVIKLDKTKVVDIKIY